MTGIAAGAVFVTDFLGTAAVSSLGDEQAASVSNMARLAVRIISLPLNHLSTCNELKKRREKYLLHNDPAAQRQKTTFLKNDDNFRDLGKAYFRSLSISIGSPRAEAEFRNDAQIGMNLQRFPLLRRLLQFDIRRVSGLRLQPLVGYQRWRINASETCRTACAQATWAYPNAVNLLRPDHSRFALHVGHERMRARRLSFLSFILQSGREAFG